MAINIFGFENVKVLKAFQMKYELLDTWRAKYETICSLVLFYTKTMTSGRNY